jgi:hypothetical protein
MRESNSQVNLPRQYQTQNGLENNCLLRRRKISPVTKLQPPRVLKFDTIAAGQSETGRHILGI